MKKILQIIVIFYALIPLKNYGQEGLPGGWHATDIGSQEIPGSSSFDEGTQAFTLESTGDQIFRPDNLHFAYTIQTGNFEIITLVSYIYGMGQMGFNVDPFEEAGLMIREDLSPFSKAYYLSVVGGSRGGIRYYIRNNDDLEKMRHPGQGSSSMVVPCFLKLRRIGNSFESYYSNDGINWIFSSAANEIIQMNPTCYVGIWCRGNANYVAINDWRPDPVPIVSATSEFEGTQINEIENIYTVQNPIPNHFLNINEDSSIIDVSPVFGHMETDDINYVAVSSDIKISTVKRIGSGDSIIFSPKSVGSSTITLNGYVNSYQLINKFPVFVWDAPQGWKSIDQGTSNTDGYVIKEGNLITIGGVANLNSSIPSEGSHFMYKSLQDDAEFTVKILSDQFSSTGGFGGISLSTDSSDQEAKMARLLYYGDGMVRFESRNNQGDTVTLMEELSATLPLWIKLKKEGNLLNAFTSEDGITWKMLGSELEMEFTDGYTGGLIAGSNDNSGLSECFFEDLTLINSIHAVNNPIPDQKMPVGLTRNIDISKVFGHPAGQIPTLRLVNSNPDNVTASVQSDSLLTLTASAVGTSVITILTGEGTEELFIDITVDVTQAIETDWKFEDIGNILKAGYAASLGDNSYSISTFGKTIEGVFDNFSFLYKEKSGSQQIVAKVGEIQDRGAGSQAGIMFRESVLPGSLYIMYSLTAYEGIKLQYRWDDNSTSVIEISNPAIKAPCWLRLSRNEYNYFTAYYSLDSLTWIPHGEFSVPLELPQTALVGLVSTSGFNEGTAVFNGVEFSIPTGIDVPDQAPLFTVQQFPNPFFDNTTLSINVIVEMEIEISVFNTAGIKVAELINEKVNPGNYNLQFNAANLNSGVYYYRIITPGRVITNKMLKIK